jgi:hypothetical protein
MATQPRIADDEPGERIACGVNDTLRIGERLSLQGRSYLVRGFDPVGVSDGLVYLEDAATGERVSVTASHLLDEQPPRSQSERSPSDQAQHVGRLVRREHED